jgi:hypothetical protein
MNQFFFGQHHRLEHLDVLLYKSRHRHPLVQGYRANCLLGRLQDRNRWFWCKQRLLIR